MLIVNPLIHLMDYLMDYLMLIVNPLIHLMDYLMLMIDPKLKYWYQRLLCLNPAFCKRE